MRSSPPSVFLQTRSTTCGVACMMMILHRTVGDPLNRGYEGKLRKKLRMRRWDLVPAINLAVFMACRGLDVRVYHEHPERFWNMLRETNEDVLQQQEKAYAYAQTRGIIVRHESVDGHTLLRELNEGRWLIFGVNLWGGIKHALLLFDAEDDTIFLVDPLRGVESRSIGFLVDEGTDDVGKWFISVEVNNDDESTKSFSPLTHP